MTGKWDDPAVPHSGWSCAHVEDLEEPAATCEMCEVQTIRYVHTMVHPDYEDLDVGCVCAGNMERDAEAPRERERQLRLVARRRASWANRVWRLSRSGNRYLNTEGFNLCAFPQSDRWKLIVTNRTTGAVQFGHRSYPTFWEAKQAALDALLWAKGRL